LEISDAVPFNIGKGTALAIERCKCPEGYSGLSCEVSYIYIDTFLYFLIQLPSIILILI